MNKSMTPEEYILYKELEKKAVSNGLIINEMRTFDNPIDNFLSKEDFNRWVILFEKFQYTGIPPKLRGYP